MSVRINFQERGNVKNQPLSKPVRHRKNFCSIEKLRSQKTTSTSKLLADTCILVFFIQIQHTQDVMNTAKVRFKTFQFHLKYCSDKGSPYKLMYTS